MVVRDGGQRSVPPGERPITCVAVGKRRERPRPRRANLAPRPTHGVAHASRVGVDAGDGRSPDWRPKRARGARGPIEASSGTRQETQRGPSRHHFVRVHLLVPPGNADAPNWHSAGAKARVKATLTAVRRCAALTRALHFR